MALRTTAAQVKAIAWVDAVAFPADADIAPFIEVASKLVDVHCEPVTTDTAELELVERWLSAHFYHVRDMKPKSARAGKSGEAYGGKFDKGLDATIYGQQAMMIDSSNRLARLNKRLTKGQVKEIGVTWVGTTKDRTLPKE